MEGTAIDNTGVRPSSAAVLRDAALVSRSGTSSPLRATVENGIATNSGMWGHVVVLRRGTKKSNATTNIPIEISVIAIVIAIGDVYLLAVSHNFPIAVRDPVRVLGGLLAAVLVFLVGSLVFALAVGGILMAVVDDAGGATSAACLAPRVAVALVGAAAGIGDGALVALYGPITFASMALVIGLAGYLRLSTVYRHRQHAAASLALSFLCCYAVSGILVASYVLVHG
jgi:hypothetical protein